MNLSGLINQWENQARHSFWNAEKAKDLFGKRFFEHRAIVYFNCIRELRVALKQFPPELLTWQAGDQSD